MKLKRFILPTVLPFCLLVNSTAQTIQPRPISSQQNALANSNVRVELENYFQKAAGLGFSGAVLVVRDGKVVLRNGYGWADVKRQIPIKPDTIFDIGSITKVLTATSIMQLDQQGKISSADPITKYFQDVPSDKRGITIHHLLTHTSGLNFDYFYDVAGVEDREIMKDRERYIKGVLSYPLGYETGKGRSYSNSGFALLAAIIEKVTGQSYEQYLRDHLFKPAGMMETGYYIPRDLLRVARGYNDGDADFGYPWETQWDGRTALWDLMGNGGVLSTLDDLNKFVIALQGEKLLSQKAKEKMFTVYYPKGNQAYGWYVIESPKGHTSVSHPLDAPPQGWNGDLRWFKEDNLLAIVLSNRRTRAASLRRYAIPHLTNIALLNTSPPLPAFVNVHAAKLRSLEGNYKLESGAVIHVKVREEAVGDAKPKPVLVISGEGQQAIDLIFSGAELSDLEKLSLELNDRTSAYIEALRKNDAVALKAILPVDIPPGEAVKRWNDFVMQYGELEKSDILGTSSLNQIQGVQTFVRLKFEKTAGVYKVTWRDQKLWQQPEDRLQPEITSFLRKSFVDFPLNVPFLPQSYTDFATYDLFKERTVTLSFGSGGKLIFHTKNGDVAAQKVKTSM